MIVAEQEPFRLLPQGAAGELCLGGDQIVSRLQSQNCTETDHLN